MKLATCAIALALFVQVLGCSGRRNTAPGECQVNNVAATVKERTPRQDPANIPVITRSRFNPDPLSSEQLREIVDRAERASEGVESIWFIALKVNKQYEDKRHWAVDVFFEPDSESPRLRRGRIYSINSIIDEIIGTSPYMVRIGTRRLSKPPLPVYVQVSETEKPFGEKLEVPNGVCMPFRQPDNLSDDELIRIVDFVRTVPPMDNLSNGDVFVRHFNPDTPLVRIERRGEGISVYNGVQEGFLSGAGDMITLVEEDGQYRVISVGMWVS